MFKFDKQHLAHLLTEYGMILVLLLLVVGFSALTVTDTHNSGAAAGEELPGLPSDKCVVVPNGVTESTRAASSEPRTT